MLLGESRKRRCEFLRAVATELDLAHVEVAEAPLERVDTRPASTISARAFAPLDKLFPLSTRFSTESTSWLLPKGRNAVDRKSTPVNSSHYCAPRMPSSD